MSRQSNYNVSSVSVTVNALCVPSPPPRMRGFIWERAAGDLGALSTVLAKDFMILYLCSFM